MVEPKEFKLIKKCYYEMATNFSEELLVNFLYERAIKDVSEKTCLLLSKEFKELFTPDDLDIKNLKKETGGNEILIYGPGEDEFLRVYFPKLIKGDIFLSEKSIICMPKEIGYFSSYSLYNEKPRYDITYRSLT